MSIEDKLKFLSVSKNYDIEHSTDNENEYNIREKGCDVFASVEKNFAYIEYYLDTYEGYCATQIDINQLKRLEQYIEMLRGENICGEK